MTRRQIIVEAVKEEFPKFSLAALSLASRDYETGVTFTKRARELKESAESATAPHRAQRRGRKKSIEFKCRLAPVDAQRVKRAIEARGGTVQDLLEELLLAWVEKEPLTAATDNGSNGGADTEPGSTSDNNRI